MALIPLVAGTTARAADLNANFAVCVLTDSAKTITVTHTWTASQTFSGGASFGAGITGTTAAFSGNASVGGTLGVTGTATMAAVNASSVSASGAITVGTTLTVTGATTLDATTIGSTSAGKTLTFASTGGKSLVLSGVDCSLDVTGNPMHFKEGGVSKGNLSAGLWTLTAVSVTGNAAVGGTLGVTGVGTLGGAVVDRRVGGSGNLLSLINSAGTTVVATGDAGLTTIYSAAISTTLGVTGITSLSERLQFAANGTGSDYSIYRDAAAGLAMRAGPGSVNDWMLLDRGGGTVARIPAASSTIVLAATVVGGAFEAASTALFHDAVTFSSTITTAGTATLASAAITGNATVAGTLGVSSLATLASLSVSTNAAVGGTLGVSGATTLSSTLGVSGGATFGSTINVTGVGTFGSNVSIAGTLGVAGAATFGSTGSFAGTVSVGALTQVSGDLIINAGGANDLILMTASTERVRVQNSTGDLVCAAGFVGTSLVISGTATIGSTLGVTGVGTFGSSVSVAGALSAGGALTGASLNLGTSTVTDIIVHGESIDFGSISSGGFSSQLVTVTGAEVGDYVFCDNPWTEDYAYLVATPRIVDTNQVIISIINPGPSSNDPAARTVRIVVIKAS